MRLTAALRATPSGRRRAGWTLVEMLIVVLVIGLIASVALPRMMDTRRDANLDVVRADLNNLSGAMALYHTTYGVYPNTTMSTAADSLLPGASGTGRLLGYSSDPDVTLRYRYRESEGYRVEATHAKIPGVVCRLTSGTIQGPVPAPADPVYYNPTPTPDIECPYTGP